MEQIWALDIYVIFSVILPTAPLLSSRFILQFVPVYHLCKGLSSSVVYGLGLPVVYFPCVYYISCAYVLTRVRTFSQFLKFTCNKVQVKKVTDIFKLSNFSGFIYCWIAVFQLVEDICFKWHHICNS